MFFYGFLRAWNSPVPAGFGAWNSSVPGGCLGSIEQGCSTLMRGSLGGFLGWSLGGSLGGSLSASSSKVCFHNSPNPQHNIREIGSYKNTFSIL